MADKEKQVAPKEPDLNTIEGQKAYAKEVDQGESARQLLEQALPYVGVSPVRDYFGDPAANAKSLRERIEAFLVLNKA